MTTNRPYPQPAQFLPNVPVVDLLKQKGDEIHSIGPDLSVYDAVARMATTEVGALLVMEEGRLLGIVSERDYARQIILKGRKSKETRVEEIMTRNVISASPSSSVQDCMKLLTSHQIRHLPVVDGTIVIGMITIGDLVRAVIEQQNSAIDELSRYVSGEPRLSHAVT